MMTREVWKEVNKIPRCTQAFDALIQKRNPKSRSHCKYHTEFQDQHQILLGIVSLLIEETPNIRYFLLMIHHFAFLPVPLVFL